MTEGPPETTGFLRRLTATGVPTALARWVVGVVFVVQGFSKFGDPIAFLKALKSYEILPLDPPVILNSLAVILPWLEIVLGVALITGWARRASALIAFPMLIVFTAAVTKLALDHLAANPEASFWTLKLDCGCGSGATRVAWKIPENLGLIALSGWVLFSRFDRFRFRPFG